MERNRVYIGDALNLIDELDFSPNMIIMSPPDLAETNYSFEEYREFIDTIYKKCYASLDSGILCSITTDRKMKGEVYLKHVDIINAVGKNPNLYKIWAKSLNTNLFILQFCHILIWKKNMTRKCNIPDVFHMPVDVVPGYKTKDSFSSELIKVLIENLTNEGDIVLDPFIGSGKTAYVCKNLKRDFLGFELEKDNVKLVKKEVII